MKILYIIIWTFILDYLCRKGYSKVSWLLVLFPFIIMFVLIFYTHRENIKRLKNNEENKTKIY